MKKLILCLSAILLFATLKAQTNRPAVSELYGTWRQTGVMGSQGELVDIVSRNYKVVNADSTFRTFIVGNRADSDPAVLQEKHLVMAGKYTVTSDSTLVEHILEHRLNPSMVGQNIDLRFRLVDSDTLYIQWNDKGKWIGERWNKVTGVYLSNKIYLVELTQSSSDVFKPSWLEWRDDI